MADRNIILHIGFPKTGTTSLQKGLADMRQRLLDVGFCYSESAGTPNHFSLEAYALDFEKKIKYPHNWIV